MEDLVKEILIRIVWFITLACACITDEVRDIYHGFKDKITWQESTLEILIYPVLGLVTVELFKIIKKKVKGDKPQSVEELREIIDNANEELKKHESIESKNMRGTNLKMPKAKSRNEITS